ncbi:hypothetical protein [Phaeobacter gallaeciensis]|uniref:hypothetical protein n=1 Tax=Phaeobacter gallaeciensis TaxID=60890 RepID=UPI000BBBEF10|nr:hypothetical protein [Phaeobacter gallaeciensis]ATF18013.1 outer membrane autotransporter barrel domain protein [Phaeobacter gallaeciensis]ATF22122.1 outer membrane autotransporter barrel domain protein [Phaeobacter gallaeciensis]
MTKPLVTIATTFALILSAGTSTAGPLPEHRQRGFSHNAHSSTSQTASHTDERTKSHQPKTSSDFGFDLRSDRHLGQYNLSATLQYPAVNSNWSWDLPAVDVTGLDAAGYASNDGIHLNWEKNQENQPLGYTPQEGRYLLGSVFLVAVGFGIIIEGTAEIIYDIYCPRGNLGPAECYVFWNAGHWIYNH